MNTDQKSLISLRYWLLGAGYTNASRALHFASTYHSGVRKDGFTPEFAHQVAVTQYLRTLHGGLLYPEDTYATALLHDVGEDYDVSYEEITNKFGKRVADACERLNKVKWRTVETGGKKPYVFTKTKEEYFPPISECPIASVVKAADRIHNFGSMVGVFSLPKQKQYLAEGEELILPVVKDARNKFPEQEPVYMNLMFMLRSQISLIRAIHANEPQTNEKIPPTGEPSSL